MSTLVEELSDLYERTDAAAAFFVVLGLLVLHVAYVVNYLVCSFWMTGGPVRLVLVRQGVCTCLVCRVVDREATDQTWGRRYPGMQLLAWFIATALTLCAYASLYQLLDTASHLEDRKNRDLYAKYYWPPILTSFVPWFIALLIESQVELFRRFSKVAADNTKAADRKKAYEQPLLWPDDC